MGDLVGLVVGCGLLFWPLAGPGAILTPLSLSARDMMGGWGCCGGWIDRGCVGLRGRMSQSTWGGENGGNLS